ncbi:MAG: DNA polymerase IV [Spirochaetes bacterium]|nr:DNA polymerase IV [Spirochaetota bacterium]
MTRLFFHVDLDAFFASVEKRDDPSLEGKPVIIGARPGHRGVVSTCSYEARAFGVHSAQPISEAFRLCPQGVFLPVRMKRYAEMSAIVMETLRRFTPDVTQISIDEAALDMTGTERLWGPAAEAAGDIKLEIFKRTGLTVSIGAGANRYVAKVASGIGKPDGLTIIEEGREAEFMAALPIEKLWGAGEKTRLALASIGVTSIHALVKTAPGILEARFGQAGARFLASAAAGGDENFFSESVKSPSMSGETTFERDTISGEALDDVLRNLADELAARLLAQKVSSRTLCLKLRYDDFSCVTRRSTSSEPYDSSDLILRSARELLTRNWNGSRPVRLIGLGLHGLTEGKAVQGSLFEKGPDAAEKARRAVEKIRISGKGRLMRARFIKSGEKRRDED